VVSCSDNDFDQESAKRDRKLPKCLEDAGYVGNKNTNVRTVTMLKAWLSNKNAVPPN